MLLKNESVSLRLRLGASRPEGHALYADLSDRPGVRSGTFRCMLVAARQPRLVFWPALGANAWMQTLLL
jgi:hypothetical protein